MSDYNIVKHLQDENRKLNKNLTEVKNELQKVQLERDDWIRCAKHFIRCTSQHAQQQQHYQGCGGISKTYTSKGIDEWYTEENTIKLIEEEHQQKIKKLRDEMKTKFGKVEKENKLLKENYNQLKDKLKVLQDFTAEQQKLRDEMKTKFDKVEKENKLLKENYNQLKDKLMILHDVTAEQLKVVRENVRGMEFAFIGGFFSKFFNLLSSGERRPPFYTNKNMLTLYELRCKHTKTILIPKVKKSLINISNILIKTVKSEKLLNCYDYDC